MAGRIQLGRGNVRFVVYAGFCEINLVWFGISRTLPSNPWWPTKADRQVPVKAASRQRRWPQASLYRACWSAILVPPSLAADRQGAPQEAHGADPGKRVSNWMANWLMAAVQ